MNIWQVMPALAVLFAGSSLYVWVCVRYPPAIILGAVAYSMITKSASLAYIETVQVYLIDVGMFSQAVGATPRQILYNLFIFAIALTIIHWIISWKSSEISSWTAHFGTPAVNRQLRIALLVSAALFGMQIINVAISPPYGIPGTGVTRYQFWDNIKFPVVADLVGVLVFYIPAIAGVALGYGKVTNQRYFRRFSIMLMLTYGIYFFLTGAVFNGPLVAMLIWLGSYWIVLWGAGVKLNIRRIGFLATTAVGAILTVGFYDISNRGIATMTGSAWDAFLYRALAVQGNVAFAADLLTSEGESHPTALLLEDMATTIYTYVPASPAAGYLEKGVNLIGSLPGNSTLVFGYWLGLLPMAIFGLLLGLISGVYILIILSGRFLLVIPGAYLCLWAFNAEAQGTFANFFEYKFSFFLWAIIIALLIPMDGQRRRPPILRAKVPSSTAARM